MSARGLRARDRNRPSRRQRRQHSCLALGPDGARPRPPESDQARRRHSPRAARRHRHRRRLAAPGDRDRGGQSELRHDPQAALPGGRATCAGDRRAEPARAARHGRIGGRHGRRTARGARGGARTLCRRWARPGGHDGSGRLRRDPRRGHAVRTGRGAAPARAIARSRRHSLQGRRMRGQCRDRSRAPAGERRGRGLRRARRRRRDAARGAARTWRRLRRDRRIRPPSDQQDRGPARRGPGPPLPPFLRRQCGIHRRPHQARMAGRAPRLLSRRPVRHARDQDRRARRPPRLLPPVRHRHRRHRGRAKTVRPASRTSRGSCR